MKSMCKGCFLRNTSGFDLQYFCDKCHAQVKARLHYRHNVGCDPLASDVVTAVFHVGFLTLEENDEHMERLRKPEAIPEKIKPSISDVQILIAPVNKTASIVTGITQNA
ncbi:MAG TPA: hypothetical protein PLN21_09320 [Gemmatales bacterium]|nr:hypothetical protein [Gemmatales bacterium]